jgi:hypothetical protein
MPLDLNHHSGLIYGIAADGRADTTARVNAHIDAAIIARNQRQAPRDYLGGSRIGDGSARDTGWRGSNLRGYRCSTQK